MPALKTPRSTHGPAEKHLLTLLGCLLVFAGGLTLLLVIGLSSRRAEASQALSGRPVPLPGSQQAGSSSTPPETGQPQALPNKLLPPLRQNNGAPAQTVSPMPTTALPASATPTVFPTPLPWDGSERINVLVLGVDYRDWSAERDIPRSDTMILLTLDPANKTAGMLSIPRDLYVPVPGMGEYKINTAYRWGELYDLPGGGTGTAMRTVQKLLGVPVDYYILLDFNSFVKFIDDIGGLTFHVREEIKVDPVGPGNTRTLEVGVQTLDGATTLAYARNRHTENDDFDRSARQQEIIMALREQVLTLDMLPSLILKAPQLASDLSSGIDTNLTLDQLVRLAWTARQIPDENIQGTMFDPHKDFIYDSIETHEGRQDILRLRPGRIDLIRKEFLGE